jgi:electron-transferring-flavoprotein dehydrogenase
MDPQALLELLRKFEKSVPLDSPVTHDPVDFLTSRRTWKLTVAPTPLRNHGNYIVSVRKLVNEPR